MKTNNEILHNLEEEEKKIKATIESLNGDMFLILGHARKLEKVQNEIKQLKRTE